MDPDPSSEYGSNLDSDSQHWLHFSDSAQQDGKDPEVIAAGFRNRGRPEQEYLAGAGAVTLAVSGSTLNICLANG